MPLRTLFIIIIFIYLVAFAAIIAVAMFFDFDRHALVAYCARHNLETHEPPR